MSLNWDLGRIPNHESACYIDAPEDSPMDGIKKGDSILSPVTRSLIWATMAVGIGEVTEAGADEFYGRLRIVEAASGAFMYGPGGAERLITLAEVRAHIGLRTNVFPKVTAAKWLGQRIAAIAEDGRREMRESGQ